ncbi:MULTISPECIES: hypothetical protein [unclassified Knoellia]
MALSLSTERQHFYDEFVTELLSTTGELKVTQSRRQRRSRCAWAP